MGVFDRFRKIKLASGKKIPMSKIGKFVVQWLDPETGKWVYGDENVSDRPVYPDEIENIEEAPAVRCVVIGKDGRFLGILWKYPENVRPSAVKPKDELSEIEDFVTKIQEMKARIEAIQSAFGGGDLIDRLLKEKEKYEMLRKIFGDRPNRNDYPLYAKLLTDREFRQGAKEFAADFFRELGRMFAEGLKEGMGYQQAQQEQTKKFLDLPEIEINKVEEVKKDVEQRSGGDIGENGEGRSERPREICEGSSTEVHGRDEESKDARRQNDVYE